MLAILNDTDGNAVQVRLQIERFESEGDMYAYVSLDMLWSDGRVVLLKRDVVPSERSAKATMAKEYEVLFRAKVREALRLHRCEWVGEYTPDYPPPPELLTSGIGPTKTGTRIAHAVAFTGMSVSDMRMMVGEKRVSRQILCDFLMSVGWGFHDQVFSDTTLLVQGPNLKPTPRIEQAKDLDVQVISLTDFLEMLP